MLLSSKLLVLFPNDEFPHIFPIQHSLKTREYTLMYGMINVSINSTNFKLHKKNKKKKRHNNNNIIRIVYIN
jgi:hypothetical protein